MSEIQTFASIDDAMNSLLNSGAKAEEKPAEKISGNTSENVKAWKPKAHRGYGGLVDKYLVDREIESRVNPTRMQGVWHISALNSEACYRKELLTHLLTVKITPENVHEYEFHGPGLQRIFDIGHAMHRVWQEEYLAFTGINWGKWECRKCGEVSVGFFPWECTCGKMDWKYVELHVRIPLDGIDIVGSIDVLGYIGGEWRVTDLKTVNSFAYNKIVTAYEKHSEQVSLYNYALRRRLVDNINPDDLPEGPFDTNSVLYIQKDTGADNEDIVEYDEKIAEKCIGYALEVNALIEAYSEGDTTGNLPKVHEKCISRRGKKFKECPYSDACAMSATVGEMLAICKE